MVLRLAAVQSHPIQYFSPMFRQLAEKPNVDLSVYYCSEYGLSPSFDPGFGREITWDRPLLDGYRSYVSPNRLNGAPSRAVTVLNPDVVKAIRSEAYDAVFLHGYQYPTNQLISLMSRVSSFRSVLRSESVSKNFRQHSRPTWKRVLLEKLVKSSRSFVYIGSENRRFYKELGVEDDRLFYGPYSVDNDFFQSQHSILSQHRVAIRQEIGICDDAPVMLFVGKLIERKKPQLLLEAFRSVRAQCACSIIFVGDGELRSSLEHTVVRHRIPDVHFAGFRNQSEIGRYYTAADIFVLPSAFETWGLVINEAMNFGLPVVASSRIGSATDLVLPGKTGFVFESGSVAELALSLWSLCSDSTLRESTGRASKNLVSNYSLSATVTGILQACSASN